MITYNQMFCISGYDFTIVILDNNKVMFRFIDEFEVEYFVHDLRRRKWVYDYNDRRIPIHHNVKIQL